MLVPIQMATSMASPYKSLEIWVKHFSGYLVYEIFLWPESWRGSLHIYILSFQGFWTLSITVLILILIYFEWRDDENQQFLIPNVHCVLDNSDSIIVFYWISRSYVRLLPGRGRGGAGHTVVRLLYATVRVFSGSPTGGWLYNEHRRTSTGNGKRKIWTNPGLNLNPISKFFDIFLFCS